MVLQGRLKFTKVINEREFTNNRFMRVYKAFIVREYRDKTTYINCLVSVFGNKDHRMWSSLLGSWIIGTFEVTGVGDKIIFTTANISNLGIYIPGTVNLQESEEMEVEDQNLIDETLEMLI